MASDALGGGLLVDESSTSIRAFCFTCHTTSDTLRGWDSTSSAFVDVPADRKVVGLARIANVLHLPDNIAAHREGDMTSCYACHGNSSAPGGNNVHNPSLGNYDAMTHAGVPGASTYLIGGATYPSRPCAECHTLELGLEHAKTTSSSAALGCSSCHPMPKGSLTPEWDKSCAQGGCHTAISTAPMHVNIDQSHETLAENSSCTSDAGCHQGDLAATHAAASEVVGESTRTSCAVCHDDGPPQTANCVTCHGDTTAIHADFAAHTASPPAQTITISGVQFGPVACADCHAVEVLTSHGAECVTCHPTPKNTLTPSWNKGCVQGGCHSVGSSAPMHASIDASHATEVNGCTLSGCHATKSLAALHSEATTTVAGDERASCEICHATGVTPTSECSDCHDTGNPHGDDAAKHEAQLGAGGIDMKMSEHEAAEGTDGYITEDCSMCHYSSLLAQHADQCALCHSGANPAGALIGTWEQKCQQDACHPAYHTQESTDHFEVYWGSSQSCSKCHDDSGSFPGPADKCV